MRNKEQQFYDFRALGQEIKAARLKQGMTRDEAAGKIHIDPRYLTQVTYAGVVVKLMVSVNPVPGALACGFVFVVIRGKNFVSGFPCLFSCANRNFFCVIHARYLRLVFIRRVRRLLFSAAVVVIYLV